MTEPNSGADRGVPGRAGHVALVVTGAPLARLTRRAYDTLRRANWQVTVCPTAAAAGWIVDPPTDDLVSGRIRPDAVICCPATFNTLNKWAAGINDSPALGVLNDALGLDTPVLGVPMVAERLSRHPAWKATLAFLAAAHVDLLDPADGSLTREPAGIPSGAGDDIADRFDHDLLLRWLGPHRQGQPSSS